MDRFLCVHGDQPASGGRSSDLNVAGMLEEVRGFGGSETFATHGPFQVGVTSRLSALPSWKREADFLFVQASFDLDGPLRWRDSLRFDGPVFAGVLVVASVGMAKTLRDATGQIDLPTSLLDRLHTDPDAGVDVACSLMEDIRASGAFDGVHLVPVGRYRSVASHSGNSGRTGRQWSIRVACLRPRTRSRAGMEAGSFEDGCPDMIPALRRSGCGPRPGARPRTYAPVDNIPRRATLTTSGDRRLARREA